MKTLIVFLFPLALLACSPPPPTLPPIAEGTIVDHGYNQAPEVNFERWTQNVSAQVHEGLVSEVEGVLQQQGFEIADAPRDSGRQRQATLRYDRGLCYGELFIGWDVHEFEGQSLAMDLAPGVRNGCRGS